MKTNVPTYASHRVSHSPTHPPNFHKSKNTFKKQLKEKHTG